MSSHCSLHENERAIDNAPWGSSHFMVGGAQGSVRIGTSHRTSIGGTYRSEDNYVLRTFWYTALDTIIHLPEYLVAGTHQIPPEDITFPFSFHLPPNIPSSAWSCLVLSCLELSGAGGVDWTTKLVIPVQALFELPSYSKLSQPMEFYTEYEGGCCCCGGETIQIWARLQKTGFYPGKTIQISVRMRNQKEKDVQSFWVHLNQNYTFWADGNKNWAKVTVAETGWERGMPTSASGDEFWRGELLVPVCAPTGLGAHGRVAQLVSMYYTLNVGADINKGWSANPDVSCDVSIGSLPPEAPVEVSSASTHQHHHYHHGHG